MAIIDQEKSIKKHKKTNTTKANLTSENRIIADWFQAHDGLKSNFARVTANSERAKQFLSFLWPCSNSYASPLNPVFLVECLNLELLNTRPLWMVRDGLIPLLWFFKINPTPKNFRGKILVHQDFAPFVPNPWRAQTGQYLIENTDLPDMHLNKIVVIGLVNEKLCSIDHLGKILDKVVSSLSAENLSEMKKSCFLVQKQSPAGNDQKQEFFLQYILGMAKKLNLSNMDSISWAALDAKKSFEDSYLVDLNDKSVFADNYLIHSILGKGARLLSEQGNVVSKSRENFIQLSPYHGISFQEKLEGECMIDLNKKIFTGNNIYFSHFESVMRSDANLGLPWPYWFTDWNKISSPQAKERGNA